MRLIKQGIYSQPLLVHQKSRRNSISSERSFQKPPIIKRNIQAKQPQSSAVKNVNEGKIIIKSIPNLQSIETKIKKANLRKEKLENIEYFMQIEKAAKENLQKRLQQNQQYLKYNKNPFIVQRKNIKEEKPQTKYKQNKKTSEKRKSSLVDALQVLRQNNRFEQLKNRVNQVEESRIVGVHKINTKLISQFRLEKRRQSQVNNPRQKLLDSPVTYNFKNMELQRIIKIEQENFFIKQRDKQPFNVFKFVTQPENQMFRSGRQKLKNLHFSIDSIVNEKNRNQNENIYKTISTYSRLAMLNNSQKKIPLSFRKQYLQLLQFPQKIQCQQLFLLINGQILPGIIQRARQIEFSQKKQGSQVSQRPNYFNLGQHINTGVNFRYHDEEAQIFYYNNLQVTANQLKQVEKQKENQKQIQVVLEKIKNLGRNKIQDDRLLQKYNDIKTNLEKKSFNFGGQVGNERMKVLRIIKSKSKKDRNQMMRLNIIREMLKKDKMHQSVMNYNPRPNCKSKSKYIIL